MPRKHDLEEGPPRDGMSRGARLRGFASHLAAYDIERIEWDPKQRSHLAWRATAPDPGRRGTDLRHFLESLAAYDVSAVWWGGPGGWQWTSEPRVAT